MHTIVCSFSDRAAAQRAVDRLIEAGLRRGDIHLEHHAGAEDGLDRATWDGMEREIAVDPHVLARASHFFDRLFGPDRGPAPPANYARAVEQGGCVLVADAPDLDLAQRATSLLHEMGGRDPHRLDRGPRHRPLRDIVAMRGEAPARAAAPAREAIRREQSERAFAFGEARAVDRREREAEGRRDEDLARTPGLRYADQADDKPRR